MRARGYAATWPQQLLNVPHESKKKAGGEAPSELFCCKYRRLSVYILKFNDWNLLYKILVSSITIISDWTAIVIMLCKHYLINCEINACVRKYAKKIWNVSSIKYPKPFCLVQFLRAIKDASVFSSSPKCQSCFHYLSKKLVSVSAIHFILTLSLFYLLFVIWWNILSVPLMGI